MSFRSTTTVGYSVRSCQVTYELIPGNMMLGHDGQLLTGEYCAQNLTNRGWTLFTLIRRVRTADPASDPPVYDQIPMVLDPVTGALVRFQDQELCHNVVSFNLEYYAQDGTFSELAPSPFPKTDPLGDGSGPNDTVSPYCVSAIRVTMVLKGYNTEDTPRTVQSVIQIPTQ